MKHTLSVLLISLALLTGCQGSQQKPTQQPTPVVLRPNTHKPHSIYKGATLFFPSTIENWQRAQLIEAARIHIDSFCSDWNISKVKSVDVYCIDARIIPCGILEGSFTGCHYGIRGENALIHIVYGKYLTLPSLYHELTHDILPTYDPKHTDKRWAAWESRAAAINKQIIDERLK